MTIDKAIRRLRNALYDNFGRLSSSAQSSIIITLEDIVDKLALGIEPANPKELPPCHPPPANPEKPWRRSG